MLFNSYETHSIAIDPVDANIIYIGTINGVYKSTNGGVYGTWMRVSLPISGVASITELLMDPNNRNILYAGAASDGDMLKTTNAGASWTQIHVPGSSGYNNALAIDATNILYAAFTNGLFESPDGGTTWYIIPIPYGYGVRSFIINPRKPDVLYAGKDYGYGVFKSTNRGGTWSALPSGLPSGDSIHTLFLNIDNHVLFVGTEQHGGWKLFLGNLPPIANAGSDQTVKATSFSGASVTLNGNGSSDPDGDTLTFNWSGPFGTATGINPTVTLPTGSNTITLTVTDTLGATGTDTVVVTVVPNNPPVLAPIGNKQVDEGQPLQFTITASDPDVGDVLTYSAGNLPTGATFDPGTRTFSWTPTYAQAGSYPNVLFTVTDSGTPPASASEAITIAVGNVNRPPVLAPIGNKQVDEGQPLQFTITASDPDVGDVLTYSAGNLPTGATFDPGTRTFSWTPTYAQAGSYPNVLFTVTDSGTPPASASEAITIAVGNVNRPPVLAPIGNKQVDEGQPLQFTITASDPDNDALMYSTSNLPIGATFDPTTQTFQWTPGYDQAGSYQEVRFTVIDSWIPPASASEAITITVGNVNRPPVLDPIGSKQVNEGQLLQFTITASDPDNDALTYEASNLPTGAIFDPTSQKFSWIPTYDQGGKSYPNIEFTVTDNGSPNELDFEVIEITVGNVNRAPVFSPLGTQCIPENQLLQFYVTATDPDGDAITYSTGPLPKGASFDASGGLFSWTPDSTQAGTYTVAFYAMDSGSPPMTGNLNVSINVGDVYTPCELADQIIQIVISLNLPKSVENSYMANLKKVCKFVEEGKTTPAINQLEAFINKVRIDISKGNINQTVGSNLIDMATSLIDIIKS